MLDRTLLTTVVVFALAGCSSAVGTDPNGNSGAPGAGGSALGGAKSSGAKMPNLGGTGSALYSTLKSTMVKECGGHAPVVPNDPSNSALVKLPNWECSDSSGGPFVMPQGCIDQPCLTAQELATVAAWIAAGAPGP